MIYLIMNRQFYIEKLKYIKNKLIRKNFLLFLQTSKKAKADANKNFNSFYKSFEKEYCDALEFKKKMILQNTQVFVENCIKNKDNLVVEQLLNILKNFSGHSDIQVYANISDIDVLILNRKNIINAFSATEKIRFIEDNTLSKGSIIVKSNKSIVDAQIKSQLSSLKNCLNKCL